MPAAAFRIFGIEVTGKMPMPLCMALAKPAGVSVGAVDGLVFDEGEGFVVGGAVHEVGEAWGELGFEGIGEGEDVEGDLFEFFEMGGGVAVAP
jgi:hypothetical protein